LRGIDPFVRTMLSEGVDDEQQAAVRRTLVEHATETPADVDPILDRRLETLAANLARRGSTADAETITALKTAIQHERLPF
jgi:hypothetical protein